MPMFNLCHGMNIPVTVMPLNYAAASIVESLVTWLGIAVILVVVVAIVVEVVIATGSVTEGTGVD